MFIKITLVLIFIQIAANQILARGQSLKNITAAMQQVQSQLFNLKEELRLVSDEFNNRMDVLETNILERLKDVLLFVNTTKITPTTTTTRTTTQKPMNKRRTCKEWLQDTGRSDKYTLTLSDTCTWSFEAYCLLKKDATEISFWTVIFRRTNKDLEFGRNWLEYARGFGDLHRDFILGLDYISVLTRSARHELWVEVQHKNGSKGWAKYDNFQVGNAAEMYELKTIGHYSGNASNALNAHIGYKWTTKDKDHDIYYEGNCAVSKGGGWWFKRCGDSCFTCFYNRPRSGHGALWWDFAEDGDVKYAQMAIREFA